MTTSAYILCMSSSVPCIVVLDNRHVELDCSGFMLVQKTRTKGPHGPQDQGTPNTYVTIIRIEVLSKKKKSNSEI